MIEEVIIPKCSKYNEFFYKDDNRVVVYNHITEKSMVISRQASNVLSFLDGEKTYGELFHFFSDLPKKDLEEFITACVSQGYADKQRGKIIKNHVSLIYRPEKLYVIRNENVRCICRLLLFFAPICSLFALCISINHIWNAINDLAKSFNLAYIIIAFFQICVSLFIHEISHAIIAKSYGANIGEISVRFDSRFPCFRIYASICGTTYIKSNFILLALYSAGILSHFFIINFFVCILFANGIYINSLFLQNSSLMMIIINIFLITLNLMPFSNMDGLMILSLIKRIYINK